MKKRILSLLLVIAFVFSVLPLAAAEYDPAYEYEGGFEEGNFFIYPVAGQKYSEVNIGVETDDGSGEWMFDEKWFNITAEWYSYETAAAYADAFDYGFIENCCTAMTAGETFSSGKGYLVALVVYPKSGDAWFNTIEDGSTFRIYTGNGTVETVQSLNGVLTNPDEGIQLVVPVELHTHEFMKDGSCKYSGCHVKTADIAITEVCVYGQAKPVIGVSAGRLLATLRVPENACYTVSESYWFNDSKHCNVNNNEGFNADDEYSLALVFTPKSGYAFLSAPDVKVNDLTSGLSSGGWKENGSFYRWTKTVKAEQVGYFRASGVTEPEPGEKPVFSGTLTSQVEYATAEYNTESIWIGSEPQTFTWVDVTDGRTLTQDDVFIDGHYYKVYVLFRLRPDSGNYFPDNTDLMSGNINNMTAKVEWFNPDGYYAVLSAEFECGKFVNYLWINGYTEPVAWQTPGCLLDTLSVNKNSPYKIVGAAWHVAGNGAETELYYSFRPDEKYYITVDVQIDEDCRTNNEMEFYLRNRTDLADYERSWYSEYDRTWHIYSKDMSPAYISYFVCGGVPYPVAGEKAPLSGELRLDDFDAEYYTARYSDVDFAWKDTTAGKVLSEGDTFIENHEYRTMVKFTVKDGYKLPDLNYIRGNISDTEAKKYQMNGSEGWVVLCIDRVCVGNSGKCGADCNWSLSADGTLTVSGTGAMYDYESESPLYWNKADQIKKIVVEDGITYVGAGAFSGLREAVSASLAESVTAVGSGAFAVCEKLESVNIPSGVTVITNQMFTGCSALRSIVFPAGLKVFEGFCFENCTSLTEITIPEGVTDMGGYTFSGCSSLKKAFVPGSAETFYNCVFYGTAEDFSVYGVPGSKAQAYCEENDIPFIAYGLCGENCTYTLKSGVLTISGIGAMTDYAAQNEAPWHVSRAEIRSVVIENGVTSIGAYAFYGCNELVSTVIPSSVRSIGNRAYQQCQKLASVTIPESVTQIYEFAFADCFAIKTVSIPASVTGIANGAFASCKSLTTITVSADNQNFTAENGVLYNKEKTILLQYPAAKEGAFKVPDCVTTIQDFAFARTVHLTEITIPVSVTSIRDYAFEFCNLTDVYYEGSTYDWAKIFITASGNDSLTKAALHCIEPQRPAAPENLKASNKSTGVSLTWDAVSGADSYIVCRNGVQLGTCAAASYTDKTAKSGSTYTYTVQAAAGDVHSADSDAAKIMYLSVPANVKCTNGSEGITVTWDKVEGATGYTLYRRLSTTTAWTAVFTSTKATTLSKLDTGVKDGKTYYYTVRANYKASDGTSYYSSKATTGTKIVCSLVSTLAAPTVKSIVNGFSSILVKWSKVTGAEGYYVYRKAENGSTWTKLKTVKQPSSGSTVSFGNTTPKNGETYTYKVVAYKGTTLSADSNEKTYMRLTYPTLTAVSTNAGKISFSWSDNTVATSFQIEYATAETFTGATRKTLTGYKTSTSYSGFESGAEYHVRVRAYVKYFNKAEGKDMFYYGTWSSADETGASTQVVKVR